MDACAEMTSLDACKDKEIRSLLNLGSDEKTLEEYRRRATKGKNFICFDEQKYFKDQEKEYGQTVSAACPTVETSSTTRGRQSKKKSGELLPLEELVHIAKKQQQQRQKQHVIASKTSRRRRKPSSS
jgi:hypothetical protein